MDSPRKRRPKRLAGEAEEALNDGFLAFADPEESDEESREEASCDGEQEQVHTDRPPPEAPTTEGAGAATALALDWSLSDLLLEEIPCTGRGLVVKTATPEVWALGRGAHAAYQGRQKWRLRILRLPSASTSVSLLFGVLAQWPGCHPMPSPEAQRLAAIFSCLFFLGLCDRNCRAPQRNSQPWPCSRSLGLIDAAFKAKWVDICHCGEVPPSLSPSLPLFVHTTCRRL